METCATHPAGRILAEQTKTRISVQLTEAATGTPLACQDPLLTKGFIAKWQDAPDLSAISLRDLHVISFAALSGLSRSGGGIYPSAGASACPLPPAIKTPAPSSAVAQIVPPPPAPSFQMDRSVFVLTAKDKKGALIGQVTIRPSLPSFDQEFVKQLGQFCFRNPKKLSSTISKVKITNWR